MKELAGSRADRLTFVVDHNLLNAEELETIFTRSSWIGKKDLVEILLKRGVDVHASGDEAVRFASECGHDEIVQLLIDYGANVHEGSGLLFGLLPRMVTQKVVELLLNHVSDI